MSKMELLAREAAAKHGLDPALVCALCEVESSWIPWAVRHEAGYEWLVGFEPIPLDSARFWVTANYEYRQRDAGDRLWQPQTEKLSKFGGVVISDGVTILTELLGQQTSWGLLQIMGAVARERGFKGWLTELCDPTVNLEWGCRHLRWMLDHPLDYGLSIAQGEIFARETALDLAAAWNGGSVRRGDDGELINIDYVRRAVRAMEGYQ